MQGLWRLVATLVATTMATTSSAFMLPGVGLSSRAVVHRSSRAESCLSMTAQQSRREWVEASLRAAVVGVGVAGAAAAPASAKEMSFQDALATLMVCQAILEPSHRYFELKQFDAARTNVNYITRVLAVRKAIGTAVIEGGAVCDDEALVEEAADLAATADATFSNYDSSIYTVIFIPPNEEGGLPNGSEKYFAQADIYYGQCVHILETLIKLAPPDVARAARATADARIKELPAFLFKEFTAAGRPPTP